MPYEEHVYNFFVCFLFCVPLTIADARRRCFLSIIVTLFRAYYTNVIVKIIGIALSASALSLACFSFGFSLPLSRSLFLWLSLCHQLYKRQTDNLMKCQELCEKNEGNECIEYEQQQVPCNTSFINKSNNNSKIPATAAGNRQTKQKQNNGIRTLCAFRKLLYFLYSFPARRASLQNGVHLRAFIRTQPDVALTQTSQRAATG